MTRTIYETLHWLCRPPADFRAQCRALAAGGKRWGAKAMDLAAYALDEAQLKTLADAIARAHDASESFQPLVPCRLGIVSNATVDLIAPALVATAARYGILLTVHVAPHNQVVQSILDPQSPLQRARPNAILVALDHRGLPLLPTPGQKSLADATISDIRDFLAMLAAGIKDRGASTILLQTIARPPEALFGSLDAVLPGTWRTLIVAANAIVAEMAAEPGTLAVDIAGLAETIGLAEWHDPVIWSLARQPFACRFIPIYAEFVCRVIGALYGRARKVLALDLDNTLWGGVIGDDGLSAIEIGEGTAAGEAYARLQRSALALHERGIVLAVSSKNEDDTARGPFTSHPDMILREEHFSAFRANWRDKAANLADMAAELALDSSAWVFLDDNPVERGLMRDRFPQVAVPELPDDPAYYERTLLAAGYFEAIGLTDEDRARPALYRARERRQALAAAATDREDYLKSLNTVVTIYPVDEIGRFRVVQLIGKSNQYNLTAKRYTEAQICELEQDPNSLLLQIRLLDSFGDSGMISVVICRRSENVWQIDTWLMSCRVLGRGVEYAVLEELVRRGKDLGIRQITGEFHPTGRNELVADHYARLGFTLSERRDDGATVWQLAIEDWRPRPLSVAVKTSPLARSL